MTICGNCGGQLVFDPTKQKLVCEHCGGEFSPEDRDLASKESYSDQKAESMNEIYGTHSEEYMDCYVYTCNSCGGEIIINGSEASTKCIYCGNSAVVFSRISKQKSPKYILPFKITKEEAVDSVRKSFKKGVFIPGAVKNFKPENVRGIYIPYWIVTCEHKGNVIVSGKSLTAKKAQSSYYGRTGVMKLSGVPLDASKLLTDESSERLEPYDLKELVPFDEAYLLGFYSNVSDITYGDLRSAAEKRARDYFNEAAIESVLTARSKKIFKEDHVTSIDYSTMTYAMLPAWFITYDYNGRHNTILVNGQTGKIVCGVPWQKGLYFTLLAISGVILSAASFAVLKPVLARIFYHITGTTTKSFTPILAAMTAGGVFLFTYSIRKIVRVVKSVDLTQSGSMFNFVKKRQE